MDEFYLSQEVYGLTRGKMLLDLVLAKGYDLVSGLIIEGKLGDSGHELITFTIHRKAGKSASNTEICDHRKADFHKLKRLVVETLRGHDLTGRRVHNEWLPLKEVILEAQRKSIPACRKGSKRAWQPPWLNRELMDCLHLKRKAYEGWKTGNTTKKEHSELICTSKEQTRKAKAVTKIQLATQIKDNKMSFFRYVGSQKKIKGNIGPLLNQMWQLINDTQEKVNLLNDYFVSVFQHPKGTTLPDKIQDHQGKGEYTPTIGIDLVREHLESLATNKSAGPDRLDPKMLKELADIYSAATGKGI
ncbi:uncharacterized protein LOC132247742 [Alligator mississippiensis]|uniref:uncharacterized protein LOC132247742 n=1 Tax=Alligator mississippiensis TaxID=8496 RepID=UPI002877EC61|nr:uncharacterized protein LOC132247742 [Alligator mississippiensis]